MKKTALILILGGLVALTACKPDGDSRFMPAFTENFNAATTQNFNTHLSPLRYYCGVHSLTEENTDVMLMTIHPGDAAGPSKGGSEIETTKMTHFGTYSARLRMPDLRQVQPNVGMVTGFFTYRFTEGFGLSEIDIEWLLADPTLIYLGTWTSAPDNVNKLQRIERTVNLATGEILFTKYRSYHDYIDNPSPAKENFFDEADDAALTPRTIPVIEGFDASSRFYVYGFDWYPNRLSWWIEHPETSEKIVLWDYQGTTPHYSGIPQSPTNFMLNFWHTDNWAVDTNPLATEAPKSTYMMEVDWIKYEPYEDLNAAWRAENKFQ